MLTFLSANAFAGKPAPTKPYRATLTPATIGAGSHDFTLTLFNDANPQQLGSANVTAPSGFVVTGLSAPAGSTFSSGSVLLRNLAIPPLTSASFTITATVPCAAGPYAWKVVAKQSNDFNGPPGNEFTPDQLLTTTVSAACRLAFVTGRGPADAAKTVTISSVEFAPAGAPILVEVQDGSGNRVTSSTAAITVGIDVSSPNPGTTTLDGTKTVNAVAGLGYATFSTLSIGVHGTYTLSATSPGITSADPSGAFSIWDEVKPCTAGAECVTSPSEPQTQTSRVVAVSGTNGLLLTSLEIGATLPCGDSYNHAPGVTTIDGRGLTGETKTATITIDKAIVQATPNNGVSTYQVCYQSDTEFTDRSDNPVAPGDAGLLPDCDANHSQPCVLSKNKTKAGQVIIAVLVPLSDPRLW